METKEATDRTTKGLSVGLGRRLAKVPATVVMLFGVRPMRDFLRSIAGTHPVRVFTYHRLSERHADGMTIAPRVFREQLSYITRHHDVVSVDSALWAIREGGQRKRPLAAITFDDGYRSVYELAFPIMREFGVVGCCFVSTHFVATKCRLAHDEALPSAAGDEAALMDWDQLALLREAGWTIGGHASTHARLSMCDEPTLWRELAGSAVTLRSRLGIQRPVMAYPFGGAEDITPLGRRIAMQAGFAACFSNSGGDNSKGADIFGLRRIDLGSPHRVIDWKARVHGLSLRWARTAWEVMFGERSRERE